MARSHNLPLTSSPDIPPPLSPLTLPSHSAPQRLLWQRLEYPSREIWLRVTDVTVENGLPPTAHLRHNFPMPDAVARARAEMNQVRNQVRVEGVTSSSLRTEL